MNRITDIRLIQHFRREKYNNPARHYPAAYDPSQKAPAPDQAGACDA